MSAKAIETLTWVLIFGGGMAGSLGVFVLRAGDSEGWVLLGAAGAAVLAGVVLIVLRSRMPPGG
jgi:hypothetical protein